MPDRRGPASQHGLLATVGLVLPADQLSRLGPAIERLSERIERSAGTLHIHLAHGGNLLRCLQRVQAGPAGPLLCWWHGMPPGSPCEDAVARRLEELSSEGHGLLVIGGDLPPLRGPHARLLPDAVHRLEALLEAALERGVCWFLNTFSPCSDHDGLRWDRLCTRLLRSHRLPELPPDRMLERGTPVAVCGDRGDRLLESCAAVWAQGGRPLVVSPEPGILRQVDADLLCAEVDCSALLDAAAERMVAHIERRARLRPGCARIDVPIQISHYHRGRSRG
ncbi:MAG: hypothetical protein ACOCXJ_08090 [Planctomycetota bacterium]